MRSLAIHRIWFVTTILVGLVLAAEARTPLPTASSLRMRRVVGRGLLEPSLAHLSPRQTYTIDFSGPSNDDSSSGSNSEGPQPSSETSSEPLGDSYDNTSAAEPSSASSANSPTGGQEEGSDSSSTTPSSASASEGEPHSGTPASSASDDGQSSDEQQVPFSGSSNHTPPVPDSATEESPSVSHSPVDVPSPAPVPPANVTTAEPLHPAPTPQPPPPPPSTKSGPPQIPPAAPENVRAMLLDKIPKAAMLGSDIHTASWRISANIPPIILGLIAAGVYLFLKLTNRPLPGPVCWLLWSDCLLVPAAAVHIASESPIANVISGLLTSITLTGHFAFLACLAGTVLAPSIAEMEEKQSEVRRGPKSRLRASLHRLQPPATDPSTSTPLLPSRAWRGPVVAAVACTTLLTITVGITNFFAMIFVALKSLSDATGALRAEACLAAITTILGNSLAFFATARSGQAFEAHRAQKAAGARALIGSCILEFADSALSIAYPYFNDSPLGQLLLLLSGLCLIFAAVMVTSVFLHASPHSARGATRTSASPEQRCSRQSSQMPEPVQRPASARPPPPPRAVITRHRQENAGVENKSGVDPARMSAGGRHVLSRLINQVRGQNATPENPAQSAPRLASGGLDDFGDPFESPELPIEMDSALSASEYHYLAQFADGGKEPCGLSAVTEESVPESEQSQSNLWQVRTGPRLQPKNQASYWQIRAGSTPIRAGANTPHRRSQVSSKTRPAHPSVHQETMMASEVRPLSQVTRLSQILASPAPTKIRSPGSSFVSAASDDDYAAGAVIISHPGVAPSAQEYGVARKVSYKASHHRHDSDASAISAVDQRDSMTSHEIIAARAQCDDAPEMPADARINSGSRYSGESWDAGFKARNDARRSKWRSHPLQRSSTGLSKRSSMPFDSQELEGFPLPPQEEGVHDTSRIGDEVRATLADAGSISGSSYEQNSLTPSTRISALLTAVGWNGSRKSEGPEPGTAPSAYGPDHPDGTFIRAPSPQRQSNSTHLSVTSFMSVLARKRDGHTDSTPALDLGHGPREVTRHPLHECTTAESLVRPLNTTSSISRPDALSKVAYDTSGAGAGRPMSAVPEVREVAARIDQPYSNANLGTADRVSVIPSIVSPADSTSNAAGPEEVGGRPSEHELTVPRAAHIVGGPNQLAWPTQNSKPAAQLLSPQDADESEDHLPSSAKGYIERPLPPTPDGKYTGPQERPGSSRSRSGSVRSRVSFIGTARAIPEPPASPTIKIERCPEETEPRPSSSIETRDPSSPAARLPVPTSSQAGLLSPEFAATHRHIGA